MEFKDIWNPTQEEIMLWAFDKDSDNVQDWELAVSSIENIDLFINLVIDKACPKRYFFIRCLYVLVGDTVRGNRDDELSELDTILLKSSNVSDSIIERWVQRSRDLLFNPDSYDYKLWGLSSEYARKEAKGLKRK